MVRAFAKQTKSSEANHGPRHHQGPDARHSPDDKEKDKVREEEKHHKKHKKENNKQHVEFKINKKDKSQPVSGDVVDVPLQIQKKPQQEMGGTRSPSIDNSAMLPTKPNSRASNHLSGPVQEKQPPQGATDAQQKVNPFD